MQKVSLSWHSTHTNKIEEMLLTNSRTGLTKEESDKRLIEFGPNEIEEKKGATIYGVFFRQFRSVVVYALLLAIGLSIYLEEYLDAEAIAIVLVINAALGTIQEYKAEKALEALKKMSALTARVLRNGVQEKVPARELVPGDIFLLEVGDKVPADGRILTEVNLSADESMLTGESLSTRKEASIFPENTPLAQRKNMVYKDTIITRGRAVCIATCTGKDTEVGKIAELLATTKETPTPLEIKLNQFMKNLGKIIVVGTIIVLISGLTITAFHITELIRLSIAQAVAFVPEGLPITVTIALAVGVTAIARKKAIVRKLPAVETLGSVSVICTDKTGTLTKNEMTVKQVFLNNRVIEVTGEGYSITGSFKFDGIQTTPEAEKGLMDLIKTGLLCNDASLEKKEDSISVIGDPTEGSLVVLAEKAGIEKEEYCESHKRMGEIQFDPDKKYMATFNKKDGKIIINVKGAPEKVLSMCNHALIEGKKIQITPLLRKNILEEQKRMASAGLRVLGFANKEAKELSEREASEMTFLGLVGMMDPVREEVKKAFIDCKKAGIKVVMITGDHKLTAESIGKEIGLMNKDSITLTGEDLDKLSEKELLSKIETVSIFARTSSEHKMRIVKALQHKGHIVAMTGDGVNDAPAIKKADIGIAMGISGTEVTKEASDIVLKDDNFSTIVEAVREGRTAYSNIKKVIAYLLGTNMSEVVILFVVLFSSLILPESLPLIFIPIQLLWINIITDGACVATLALEKDTGSAMNKKPRSPKEPLITHSMLHFIGITSIMTVIGTLAIFIIDYYYVSFDLSHARTLAFMTLAFFQLFSTYNVRSSKTLIKSRPHTNPALFLAVVVSIMLLFFISYAPVMNNAMKTVPLTPMDWIVVISISATILIVFEVKKFITFNIEKQKMLIETETN